MIGKLKGVIDSYGEDFVIVDVGGVGYMVHCSARSLQTLPAAGEPVVLSIETHVREDHIRLFGFLSDVEREWFRLLQTVQGVGTKVALSVLGTLKPADLANAVAMRDKASIARSPGVGPKVAERIVTELKDKAPAYTSVGDLVNREAGHRRVGGLTANPTTREQRQVRANPGHRSRPSGALQHLGRGLSAERAVESLFVPPEGAMLGVGHRRTIAEISSASGRFVAAAGRACPGAICRRNRPIDGRSCAGMLARPCHPISPSSETRSSTTTFTPGVSPTSPPTSAISSRPPGA
jgi:holliday junction DNA helicase RuvA